MKFILLGSALLAGLIFSGCNSECCQDVVLTKSVDLKGNKTPVPVITGLPSTVPCGTLITALGTESYDPDGSIEKYEWFLDNEKLSLIDSASTHIPCDGQPHKVCLIVTDNKNASQQVCQIITVDDEKPLPVDTCNMVPKITFEKADAKQYKFSCQESTYNDAPIDSDIAAECQWTATKTFQDGTINSHDDHGPVKWVNVDPATFKALDLTLTVKKDDCEKTITEHYIIPQDLPY